MDSAVGLAILLASLACLGTWPALLDLSSLHGRHPSHAYLDYATTILVVASVLALASQEPLLETSWASIALAGGGGCLLMLGNLSMQRSLLLGVPLSIVLPLQGSLCVVLGTSVNYVLQPARSEPTILFCGVAAFLAASPPPRTAHDREADADGERERRRKTACARLLLPDAPLDSAGQQPLRRGASPVTGLFLAAAGGCCFGFFTPAFNLAVNDELGWAAAGGGRPLGVFAANGFFCLAFAASAWVVNLALMRWPPPGARRSSLTEYLHSWRRLRGRGRALPSRCSPGCSARSATPRSSWAARSPGSPRRTWSRRTRWSAPSGAWASSESSAARRAGCAACSPPCTARSSPPWRCSR